MNHEDDDEDVPLLDDILRPGDTPPADPGSNARPESADATDDPDGPTDHPQPATLSDEEIEAIAHRVVERHTRHIEDAVARAIRKALEIKSGRTGSSDTGE